MKKNTPLDALTELRHQLDSEVIDRHGMTNDARELTGVFMSRETFEILKQADENCFHLYAYIDWQKTFNTPPIESNIQGFLRCGYVMIDDKLAKGKIVMRHYGECRM